MSGDNGPTTEWLHPTDWYMKQFTTAEPWELELWEKITSDLPRREDDTPYHSGPYSLRTFKALAMMGYIPGNRVLEIGFCLGHSARAFLHYEADNVTSLENSTREQTVKAASIVRASSRGRWRITNDRESLNGNGSYDIAYIDGDHSVEGVDADVQLCLKLGIRYLWFDDFFPHWGPGTQPAIVKYGLKIKSILGTTVLTEAP